MNVNNLGEVQNQQKIRRFSILSGVFISLYGHRMIKPLFFTQNYSFKSYSCTGSKSVCLFNSGHKQVENDHLVYYPRG